MLYVIYIILGHIWYDNIVKNKNTCCMMFIYLYEAYNLKDQLHT